MPETQPARRVFISYARRDASEAAHRLRKVLEGRGCEVWLDTRDLRGGASWSSEIEAALNRCDVLVAVMSEGSFVSENCRSEHIWALDKGKVVIPVLVAAGGQVPLYFGTKQRRLYPQEEAALLADITAEGAPAPAARALRYDTVPNLPRIHIALDEPLAELRDLVFTGGEGANVVAIAGMGGIGKTVLATALCRDPIVQRAFPDGITWITIGREWDGDFVTRMREVARALGDDLSGYDNPLACENRYRTVLREKAALVVVDDVWNLENVKALLVDAPRSRFLFTTRDAGIAKAVTDRRYSVSLLGEREGRDLLARWAGIAVEKLPPEADRIIRQCGELMAAVSQVGASLRDLSEEEWRDTLDALERADISGIEDRLPPGQKSFFRSLAVSVDALPAPMQERYRKLAVLLEDVPAPLPVLRTLWKVNEAEARKTARLFVERSLGSWEQPEEPARGIRLHDLQLDYVRAHFEDQAALRLIHGAMRLSAQTMARRPEEFASQMVGRLLPFEGTEAVAEFMSNVTQAAPRPWLRPTRPCLDPPGTCLIRTLVGHSDSAFGVALTADGRRAVSASQDKTLKIWDLDTGQELRTLVGHSDAVYDVAVAADGRYTISASRDCTVKVWDAENGLELRTLAGHSAAVYDVAVTTDGRLAVSASGDKSLKVWDLESGEELRTLAGHSESVNGVAITADGRHAISASGDMTLKVWELGSGRELGTLTGHSGSVNCVAVTADGRCAISASSDKTLKVWDLESSRELRILAGHTDLVSSVAVTPDGRCAVSGSHDRTLIVWNPETGEKVRTLAGHWDEVKSVSLSVDGRLAISAGDLTLKLWNLEGGQEQGPQMGHSAPVVAMAVSAAARRAVSASWDNTLKVWDTDRCQELCTLSGHSSPLNAVALGKDGRRAVSASEDMTLKVWDTESGQELRTLAGHSASVNGVAVTGDGRYAVSASEDMTLKVWDTESGAVLRTMSGHSASVLRVAITGDGRRAVSASVDHTLKLWDLESGEELRTLEGHSGSVAGLALTPDGRRAVSASQDKTLKVWDLENGHELRTLAGHTELVFDVAVTADGRRAISASFDNMLKVWDLQSGTAIAGFTCDDATLSWAFVEPDRMLGGGFSGRLYWLKLEM